MKISYNWLKDMVDFDLSPQQLCDTLTFLGIETSIVSSGVKWQSVITAKVLEKQKHPNADKLSLCKVTDGTKDYEIVCGAANVDAGQIIALAVTGAVLPGDFVIKQTQIRGVSSQGMICSEQELGLKDSSQGIMVLDADTPVGKNLEDVIDIDTILEIEITTNRGDCLSHLGISREIAAKLKKIPNIPQIKTLKFTDGNIVEIKEKELCTRYIGCHIKGVKVAPSPKWMKDRLEKCGIKSINNIVDITNYVLLETGQPLHAFDASIISSGKVIVRKALAGEKITALDGKTHELTENMLLIADAAKPLAIAGVIGGQGSCVTENTADVFLESAVFNPISVRKTSKALNISTDASYRYERGTSWEIAELAGWRAVNLICELAGGRLDLREDVNSSTNKKTVVQLRVERVAKILGYKIDEDDIADILRFLGIEISTRVQNVLIAEIPSWRNDIKEEIDLIEEVARVNGYENIPVTSVSKSVNKSDIHSADVNKIIKDITAGLVGLGFCEAINYSFAEIKDLEKLHLEYFYKIANPISKENEVLRPSLLSGLMKNFEFNTAQGVNDIKLFEIGRIFDKNGERKSLGILMAGPVWQTWWQWDENKINPVFDFYFAGGIIKNVLSPEEFAVSENKAPSKYFHPGKTASILFKGKSVGQFGVLRPDIAVDFQNEIIYAEIDIETIEKNYENKIHNYKHVAKFPSVKRDISIVCAKEIKFDKIEKTIKQIMKSGGILKDFSLFSVYESEKLGENKISYSLRLFYRHDSKTLNDEEVNADMQTLLNKLNKDLDISLRS